MSKIEKSNGDTSPHSTSATFPIMYHLTFSELQPIEEKILFHQLNEKKLEIIKFFINYGSGTPKVIANKCNLSQRYVNRYLKELESYGFIIIHKERYKKTRTNVAVIISSAHLYTPHIDLRNHENSNKTKRK